MVDTEQSKMRSKDRIFVLSIKDSTKPKGATGMVDTKLFTGDNKLHAKMEPETCFWYMQYEHGIVPQTLRNKYTTFSGLKNHAEAYFKNRNIEIKEILD